MHANTDRKKTCIVGKLLARMKYENEESCTTLTSSYTWNMMEISMPSVRPHVNKTRNPIFNEFFKVVCASENS